MSGRSRKFSFEKALAELEATVEQMESGNLSLEDSLKAYEKGIGLTRQCQQALKEAEQKIQVLADGKLEAFDPDDSESAE